MATLSRYNLAFITPPVPGFVFALDGQPYTVTAVEPFQCEPGPAFTIHFRSLCAQCGAPFEGFFRSYNASASRRCPAHRAPGRKVPRRVHSWPVTEVA